MKRAIALIAAIMLMVGCSSAAAPRPSTPRSSTAADTHSYVTGYRVLENLTGSQKTSGPISVALSAAAAIRIERLVAELPPGPGPSCMEPAVLTYKIELNDNNTPIKVDGYRCAAAVSVAPAGEPLKWHRDTSCALDKDVQRLLPATARGTESASIGCD